MHVVTKDGHSIVEGTPGERLLKTPEDVVEVIGACFEQGAQAALLYAENLTERFFDLSSGEAGTILQKLRNYRIRLAVVAPAGGVVQSSRFGEMLADEMRGNEFRLFEDKDAAEAWLAGAAVRQ
jgi:hypothetical protein